MKCYPVRLFLFRSFLWALCFTGAVGFATAAKADLTAVRNADNAVWASVGSNYLNYKETDANRTSLDTEHGAMASFSGGVSYLNRSAQIPFLQDLYVAAQGRVTAGKTNYDGSLMNGTPWKDKTDNTISQMDGRIGKGFTLANTVMLIPYAEVGYRQWNRDLGSYSEEYSNYELLGGVMAQAAVTDSVVLSVWGAGGETVSPRMKASDMSSSYDLTSKATWKVGGKVGYTFMPHLEMFLNVDYLELQYGHSQSLTSPYDGLAYYEPDSKTRELATQVGIAYHF